MPNYTRPQNPGSSWFFTVNLLDRQSGLLVTNIAELRDVLKKVKQRHPFQIDAITILPDHLHTIWTLPEDDSDFSTRWGLIKSHFSRQIPKTDKPSASRQKRGERGIWQRRFWEHAIRDEQDFQRHIDYCYINPVKHGYVGRVVDWPHSSFHRDVKAGIYPKDWAGDWDMEEAYGER